MDKQMTDYDKAQLREAIIKSVGGKKLQTVGNSMAILVPKMWAQANATKVDGNYYIKIKWIDAITMQISPIDSTELSEMFEVNHVQ